MRSGVKFFLIAMIACMMALLSYDVIFKPLQQTLISAVGGMLHSRTTWFQQRVVQRANCLSAEVMAEMMSGVDLQNVTSRVSRIVKRYRENVDPWGTRFSVDVFLDDCSSFKIVLVSAGADRNLNTDDDVCVTNIVAFGVRRLK